jgi:hypothetical protein
MYTTSFEFIFYKKFFSLINPSIFDLIYSFLLKCSLYMLLNSSEAKGFSTSKLSSNYKLLFLLIGDGLPLNEFIALGLFSILWISLY